MAPDVCRLCACRNEYCVPIFGEDADRNLLKHKLRVCSPIIVKQTDTYPKQICINCLSSIDQVYEFYQTAKNAQLTIAALMKVEMNNKRRMPSDSEDGRDRKKVCQSAVFAHEAETSLKKSEEPKTSNEKPPLYVKFDTVASEEDSSLKIAPVISEKESTSANPNPIHPKEKESSVSLAKSDSVKNKACKLLDESIVKIGSVEPMQNKSSTDGKASKSLSDEGTGKPGNVETSPNKSRNSKNTVKSGDIKPLRESSSNDKSAEKARAAIVKPVKREQVQTPVKPSTFQPSLEPENISSKTSTEEFKKCMHCDREFSPDILPQHESLHFGNKVFTCDPCNRSFFHEGAYTRHLKRHH